MAPITTYPVQRQITTHRVVETDPSRSATLRRLFVRACDRRFNRLNQLVVKAVKMEDVFGLVNSSPVVNETPGQRRFNFPRDFQKIEAFIAWLQEKIDQGVLDQVAAQPWTNSFINEGYSRGVRKARTQLGQAGYNVPAITASGGIRTIMMNPTHLNQIELLFTRTFNELKGITNDMSQRISRALADGLSAGESPDEIAKRLSGIIHTSVRDSGGRFMSAKRRAQLMARTEIIRAHADAQLREYEAWGALGVKVKAEWVTSGNACPECAGNESEVFSIEEAQGMIPLHPNCKCIWLPINAE